MYFDSARTQALSQAIEHLRLSETEVLISLLPVLGRHDSVYRYSVEEQRREEAIADIIAMLDGLSGEYLMELVDILEERFDESAELRDLSEDSLKLLPSA